VSVQPKKADLTIRSRRIHTPDGWRDGVVVVYGETIAGVVPAGLEPPAVRHVDAGDDPVIPGLIDTHVHLRDPGFTDKDGIVFGAPGKDLQHSPDLRVSSYNRVQLSALRALI